MKPMELAAIMALTDAGKHASRLENQTSASPISALRSSFLPGEGGNHARYDNEYFTARFLEAEQMVDAVERDLRLGRGVQIEQYAILCSLSYQKKEPFYQLF